MAPAFFNPEERNGAFRSPYVPGDYAVFLNSCLRNTCCFRIWYRFFQPMGKELDFKIPVCMDIVPCISNFHGPDFLPPGTGTGLSDIRMFRIRKRTVLQLREQAVDAACDHLNRHDGKNQPHQPRYNVKAALPEFGNNRR